MLYTNICTKIMFFCFLYINCKARCVLFPKHFKLVVDVSDQDVPVLQLIVLFNFVKLFINYVSFNAFFLLTGVWVLELVPGVLGVSLGVFYKVMGIVEL